MLCPGFCRPSSPSSFQKTWYLTFVLSINCVQRVGLKAKGATAYVTLEVRLSCLNHRSGCGSSLMCCNWPQLCIWAQGLCGSWRLLSPNCHQLYCSECAFVCCSRATTMAGHHLAAGLSWMLVSAGCAFWQMCHPKLGCCVLVVLVLEMDSRYCLDAKAVGLCDVLVLEVDSRYCLDAPHVPP